MIVSINAANRNTKGHKSRFHTGTNDDEVNDNASCSSSISSMTDHDNDDVDKKELAVPATTTTTTTTTGSSSSEACKGTKSKFTITKATTTARLAETSKSSPMLEAVSISFLSPVTQETRQRTQPGQVIQRALAGLRPGGIFFVLDYQEDTTTHPCNNTIPATVACTGQDCTSILQEDFQATSMPLHTCSMAVREIPPDLVQQWNLTMVPTNLEPFCSTTKTKQSCITKSAPPLSSRGSLPTSKRIVRWMGIKPRHQVSPQG